MIFHCSISRLFQDTFYKTNFYVVLCGWIVSISERVAAFSGYTSAYKTYSSCWVGLFHALLLTFRECHLYLPLPGSWVTIMLLYFVLTKTKIFLH